MQNQLPARTEREAYEFFPEPQNVKGTYPAPEGGFPRFDGYSVSVKVREASVTYSPAGQSFAPEQPIIDAQPAQFALPPVHPHLLPPNAVPYAVPNSGPGAVQQPAFQGPQMQSSASSGQLPAATATSPTERKAGFGKDAALWICVAQLAVIIGLIWNSQPKLQTQVIKLINMEAVNKAVKPAAGGRVVSAKKKSAAPRAAHAARSFRVPPPPAELAHIAHVKSKHPHLMVPPPPATIPPFNLVGPGAVAASTLAFMPAATKPAKVERVFELAAPTPAPHTMPELTASAASFIPSDEPAADTDSASADEEVQTSTDPGLFRSYNWSECMKAPSQAPHVPASRTVMQGNRKRTITER